MVGNLYPPSLVDCIVIEIDIGPFIEAMMDGFCGRGVEKVVDIGKAKDYKLFKPCLDGAHRLTESIGKLPQAVKAFLPQPYVLSLTTEGV